MPAPRRHLPAILLAAVWVAIAVGIAAWRWPRPESPSLAASYVAHLKSGDERYDVECNVLYQSIDPAAWRASVTMGGQQFDIRMPGFELVVGGKSLGRVSATAIQEHLDLPDSEQGAGLSIDLHSNLFRIMTNPASTGGSLGVRRWETETKHDPDHWFEQSCETMFFPKGTPLPR